MQQPNATRRIAKLYGTYSSLTALCMFFFPIVLSNRFVMRQYSHNAKIGAYSIAVIYNLVNSSSVTAQAHLSMLTRHVDMMNLIFSKGLPEDEGSLIHHINQYQLIFLEASSLASPWIVLLIEAIASQYSEENPLLLNAINTLETASYDLVSPAQLLFLSYLLDSSDSNPEFLLPEICCRDLLAWMNDRVLRSHTIQEVNDHLQFDVPRLEQCKEETEEGKKLMMLIEAMGCCLSLVASQASGKAISIDE